MTVLVTGGAGFIGRCFAQQWSDEGGGVAIIDNLSFAGDPGAPDALAPAPFFVGDIGNFDLVKRVLNDIRPTAIVNFAAETHVDRSLQNTLPFVRTNVVATEALLQQALAYWRDLPPDKAEGFRFLHVSTDEVFGSRGECEPAADEATAYQPRNPYAASKAAGDHFVRAAHHSHGLPVLITHCTNNYGPYQLPEKFVPVVIARALAGCEIPIYGEGDQVREWIYVSDHCKAISAILRGGRVGESYNITAGASLKNIELVRMICTLLDEARPGGAPHFRLVTPVKDRAGHDRRYALDGRKIRAELGWKPQVTLAGGMRQTIDWYLNEPEWLAAALLRLRA